MKRFSIEIKWGIIFILVMLVWMYFEKLMGWHDTHIDKHAIYTNLFAIPAIIIYVLAIREKRERTFNGKLSWLQGFLSGVLLGFIVAVMSPLEQIIALKYITPDYLSNAIEYSVNQGKMTLLQAEDYFSMGNYILQSVIGALAMGTITGAIVAIFLRKK